MARSEHHQLLTNKNNRHTVKVSLFALLSPMAEKVAEEKKPPEEAAEEGNKEEAPAKAEPPPPEDEKKEEKKPEESKEEQPPQEIILRVFMHCKGCATKVRRCLKDFQGVEDVIADCRTNKVVVKGEKADPQMVLERVEKKSHRRVELISPIPSPPPEQKEVVTPDHKDEEPPPVITVELGVYMHCDACAQEIKRRIKRIKGIESVEPDLKSSQVKIKGVFEPQKLVDYVYKRTGKHAVIISVEPEKKEDEKAKEVMEEKKAEEDEQEAKKEEEVVSENKEDGGDTASSRGEPTAEPEVAVEVEVEDSKMELSKSEFYHYYPQNYQMYPPSFVQEMNAYPPQIFSDENPNACSVM